MVISRSSSFVKGIFSGCGSSTGSAADDVSKRLSFKLDVLLSGVLELPFETVLCTAGFTPLMFSGSSPHAVNDNAKTVAMIAAAIFLVVFVIFSFLKII